MAEYIKLENIEPGDPRYPTIAVTNKGDPVYLPPVLVIHVASYLSVKLRYDILTYYLSSHPAQVNAVLNAENESLKLENQNLTLQLNIKLNRKA